MLSLWAHFLRNLTLTHHFVPGTLVSDLYDQLIEILLEVFLYNFSVIFLVSSVKRMDRTLS